MLNPPDHAESHTLRGATDRPALLSIRDVIKEMEPLATPELDDDLHPSVLEVILEDGLCTAESARIDIQWTTRDEYKFHYTDTEGVNLRWGKHSHAGDYIHVSGLAHYHPPPAANSNPDDVKTPGITVSPEELVTRAVLKIWRVAYHTGSYGPLSTGRNLH